jgi:hypothetical protein
MILVLALLTQVADTTRRPCDVVFDQAEDVVVRDVGGGEFDYFVRNGFAAHCRSDPNTNLRSDSAAYYALTGRLDLVRRVRIEDPGLEVTADHVTYFLNAELVESRGNVDAVNRSTGTRIRGPSVDYYRPAAGVRDTVEIVATQRPTIDYVPRVAAADTEPPEPYVVVGDRVRMHGEDRLWGGGTVTINRSDLAASGDSMWLDFAAGRGELLHSPSVSAQGGDTITLRGDLLDLALDGEALSGLTAFGTGEAVGTDFTLTGDTIALGFADDQLDRVQAWGDRARPHIVTPTYEISADSLALDLPDQQLHEARGYGQALALTSASDSTRAEPDWLAGDTLQANFVETPATDSTEGGTRLERAVARGAARAFYVVVNADDPEAPPGYSYSRGDEITLSLDVDGVRTVHVVGGADGVYLRPVTRRDSTRAR